MELHFGHRDLNKLGHERLQTEGGVIRATKNKSQESQGSSLTYSGVKCEIGHNIQPINLALSKGLHHQER